LGSNPLRPGLNCHNIGPYAEIQFGKDDSARGGDLRYPE
jgi:hypothetical protein